MFGLLEDTQQRHRVLTVLMAAAVLVYVTGAAEVVCGFDLAMLAALVGGCPIFYSAAAALVRGRPRPILPSAGGACRGLPGLPGDGGEHAPGRRRGGPGDADRESPRARRRQQDAAGSRRLALRPETARVRSGNREHFVPIDEIEPEDIVIVRPGDRIAVDGAVVAGSSAVDQSPIIGERCRQTRRLPRVFAGTINLHGTIEVEAERVGQRHRAGSDHPIGRARRVGQAPSQRLADRWPPGSFRSCSELPSSATRSVETSSSRWRSWWWPVLRAGPGGSHGDCRRDQRAGPTGRARQGGDRKEKLGRAAVGGVWQDRHTHPGAAADRTDRAGRRLW